MDVFVNPEGVSNILGAKYISLTTIQPFMLCSTRIMKSESLKTVVGGGVGGGRQI